MVTNSALPSYPNLFIFFCPTLLASSEHRLLPMQADSSAHQKETKFSQLLTHFSNLYTLAIPNKLCILLHTESHLHQKPHILACLRPPNNASVRLQAEVLSPRPSSRLLGCPPTYLVRSPFSSALSSSSRFQTAIQPPCSFSAAVTDPQPRYYPCKCNARAAVIDTKRLKKLLIRLPDQWALKN
jgi:hypothetical protein